MASRFFSPMLSGQVDYQVSSNFDISGAIRVEREEGTSGSTASTERTNVGSFVEARGMVLDRVYLIGGLGFEDNGLFGYATTPRLSASIFLREPSSYGLPRGLLLFNTKNFRRRQLANRRNLPS